MIGSKKGLRYILISVIILGVFMSLYLSWQRHSVEQSNRQVEIAVDWDQVKAIAKDEKISAGDALAKFAGSVTGIVFKEQTAADLIADGDVIIKKGTEMKWELIAATGIAEIPVQNTRAAVVHEDWSYLIFSDAKTMTRVSENLALKHKGKEDLVIYYMQTPQGALPMLGTSLSENEIINIGIGFDQEGLNLAAAQKFDVLPQVRSWLDVDEESLNLVFHQFAGLSLGAVFFNDEELPGVGLPVKKQDEAFQKLAQRISDLNVPLGMIEFFPQKGLASVAEDMDKDVVRMHAIRQDEMTAMTQSRAVERFTMAATDRDIRVLLVRFFPNASLHDNVLYLEEIHDSLESEGFTLGEPASFGSLPFSPLYLIILALAVAAGGILLFAALGYEKLGLALGLLGFIGAAGLVFIGHASLARKGLALISVIVFPTLSITLNLKQRQGTILSALGLFVRTTFFSLIGAVLMVGLLADTEFMYTLNQFMGVKLAHVMPLFLLILIFWFVKDSSRNPLKKIIRVLDYPVTVKYVALLGILMIVLLIYIIRTGNENAAVSSLELMIRSKLEYLLAVRPRTKEFLIGHPLMILMFYLGYKDKYLPLLMVGAIGQVSAVNTFAHIHTPLVISLMRTFNGMWLGAIIGLILIGCYRIGVKIWSRLILSAEN